MRAEIPDLKSAAGMARHLIDSGQAVGWLGEMRRKTRTAAIEEADRKLVKMPACYHGMFGGDHRNEVTGKKRCGQCETNSKLPNAKSEVPDVVGTDPPD
jgi:hypothetical protein